MAMDEMKDVTKENVSFDENPLQFCRNIYKEAVTRNDDLREVNLENRLFYEGKDAELDARKTDPEVQRNGVFIQLLKPAIDTRISDTSTRVDEREFPITFRPRSSKPTKEEHEQADWIEKQLNYQLRECGYLSAGFEEHCLAAEIYRTPSAVKVGWEFCSDKVPVVEEKSVLGQLGAMVGLTKPKVKWVSKYKGGRPYVEWIYPEEFLYQPNLSKFQKDSTYCIHQMYLTKDEIMSRAAKYDWDEKKVKKALEKPDEFEGTPSTDSSQRDAIEKEKGTPFDKEYREGKYLVTENYIVNYDDKGNEELHVLTVVCLKEIVKKVKGYKGVKFPFVLITSNNLPGTIEQLSTVDIGKGHQRLYNEIFNSYLDGASYRLFPPMLVRAGMQFQKRPKWGLGQLWYVADLEAIRPLIDNPGELPNMPALMDAVSAKLRDAVNSIDLAQGFQATQYEKATSSKLRAAGAERRSTPTNKRYGMALVEVAQMILALDQQFHDEAHKFVMDGVIDCPSLTNVSDPETEKQDILLLYTQALQDPLYQSPMGIRKRRNILEDVWRKFKKNDIDRFVPTEAEMEAELAAQMQQQDLMLQKAAMQEEMAMQGQAQQQMMEGSNASQSQPAV